MKPATALRRAIEAGTETPRTFAGVSELFDGSAPQMAVAMAGTRDKKSNAYKAALRNVQRYRQGTRKPGAAMMAKLAGAAAPRALRKYLADIQINGMTVTMTALVLVSSDERWRSIDGQYVSPGALEDATSGGVSFFQLAESRQWGPAADAFAQAFFGGDGYGIGLGVQLVEIDALDITPG